MGRPELAEDERYAMHSSRGEHQQELDDLISEWTKTLSSMELRELMNKHGVPNGKIYKASDMLEDEHFKARDAIISLMHPKFDEIKMQNVFPKLSETPGKVKWCGPELGEHNKEIYSDLLNIDDGRLKELEEKGII